MIEKLGIIYCRTSTSGQALLATIQAQLDELPAVAIEHDVKVVETIVDDGKSGRQLDGRKLLGYLDRLEGGEDAPKYIVLAETSRIIREDPDDFESMSQAARVRFLFRKHGIILVTPQKVWTFKGEGHADVFRQMGEDSREWQRTRTRTQGGKRKVARRGRPATGFLPWGFRWVRTDRKDVGRWELIPEVVDLIRWVFTEYVSGVGAPTIAGTLNERAVITPKVGRETTKAKKGQRSDAPTRWHAGTVLQLLKNPAYVGRWVQRIDGETFHHKPVEALSEDDARLGVVPMPRVVSDELFERAQAIMGSRGNRRPPQKLTNPLLSGVAQCGHCGRAIVSTSAKLAGGVRKARYVCTDQQKRYTDRVAGGCGLGSFNADEIDEIIWARIERLLLDSEALAVAASLREEAGESVSIERELHALERTLKKNDDEVQKVIVMVRRGKITDAQLDAALERLKAERLFVERNRSLVAERLERTRRVESVTKSMVVTLERLRREVRGADAKKRNEILRALCPTKDFHLVLTRDGRTIELTGRICLEVAQGAQLSVEVA
ncbi:MAG: recombinase family protein [Sandaracinaceae bacterium]